MNIGPVSENIYQILDLARWAPSGDNCQPWKFEILSDTDFLIHLQFDTENIYEYKNGQPALIALGCLIENISIAASLYGYDAVLKTINPRIENSQTFEIHLVKNNAIQQSDLADCIAKRSVHRGICSTSTIPQNVKEKLENCMPSGVRIKWHSSFREKINFVRMYMLATDIRLRIPETYEIHREMLDWKNYLSPAGVPVGATGLSSMTIGLMRIVMKSYKYLNFMNRYMFGTLMPRIELDLLPGLFCASHFTINIENKNVSKTTEDIIQLGRSVQKLWLTLTKQGLVMQPELAPLVFASYANQKISFTSDQKAFRKAEKLVRLLKCHAEDGEIDRLFFMGRIGSLKCPKVNKSRSVRLPLDQLMVSH